MCQDRIDGSAESGYNPVEGGEVIVAIAIKELQTRLTPEQTKQLNLPRDWEKRISREFVVKVVRACKRFEPAIRELEKY